TRAVHRALPPLGIPTQVVDPSVSRAAALQGFAGTIFVEIPSSAGMAKPLGEPTWSCPKVPPRAATAATGADCPVIGGEDAPLRPVLPGGLFTPAWTPAPLPAADGPPTTFALGA